MAPLKLKLEPIGAAIRLTPQHHSFLSKFKRHSITSYIQSRRPSAQETIKEQDEEEEDYLKQLAEFDKKRLRLSHCTVTDKNGTDPPKSPTSTIKTVEPPPSIFRAAVESEESESTKYYPTSSPPLSPKTSAAAPPLSPRTSAAAPPLSPKASLSPKTSSAPAGPPPLPEPPKSEAMSSVVETNTTLHKPSASQSTVSSQTPSVSSSILFPQNESAASSTSTSPSLFSTSSSFGSHSILDDSPPPCSISDVKLTRVERLQKEIDSLQDSAKTIRQQISLLTPILDVNPYMYTREQRAKTKEQYDYLTRELEKTEKRRHETGLKLSRAWKRQHDTGTAAGSFWVHSHRR
ncbi:hypothetical protein TRICI_004437 [Trichomonascus ciferrii]|uniref:Uncharacterized protein n=1 Tax=Trichomonascus ciferrii TaxID=44093 RepID=A0A642V5V5_9ASCO|nr:hypothetical protein TRICI_004437 [Trichomonascus ciferrii]